MRTYEVYVCDPELNTECSKTLCQEFCKATAFAGFAKRDENGAPIIAEESDRVPQIKINREVFEKCEEETETITVSKGCLKTRTGRFVVYDVEYLKNHIEQEAAIYGNVSAITDKTEDRPTGRWIYTGDYLTEGMLKCSKCGKEIDVSESYYKFCPNCGARMAESEE